ncbi:formylglycine-generating enzyme family protein [Pseudoxanthomonas sp. PXM02]|uniref:formylglycine-generating enzyme family protein n=1 Tax=Pseudoxanthomonas sp. PXM02 TaxID=2769294 RepID=UPI001781FE2D|nr:formylglycine-generating enzyme family protein [Pseudoxanthomonas sp. PXM02]MBD9481325.1 formylglycine-generating enzyme family protein [Pseudoxanthomonas sp. PXM02]
MKRTLPPTVALLFALASAPAVAGDAGNLYRPVEGGDFRSSVRYEEATRVVQVASFSLMARPVSNRDFADFLQHQPQWRRDRVPAVFASPGYLGHWAGADAPGDGVDADAPVVHVNWYAADAYCRAQQARLPRFVEWEYAAAADATRRDARGDAAWRMRQVNDGTPRAIDAAPDTPANAYGLHGLHGAHWEWSEDYASLLGDGDRRGQQDGQALRYCGATAMSFNDPGDYGVVKRFVLLSALQPGATLGNLGFRCARSTP